jgi:hypothetical protein
MSGSSPILGYLGEEGKLLVFWVFLVELVFELRALHLQSRHSTA